MVKYIAPVLLAVFMMVFLNISHAQQPFVDRFIVLELDLTKSDAGSAGHSGLKGSRNWTFYFSNNKSYQFTADKEVSKEVVDQAHDTLDFTEFKAQLEKWAHTNDIYDFSSGKRQFEHLYIKETSEEGVKYYHAKFNYRHLMACAG